MGKIDIDIKDFIHGFEADVRLVAVDRLLVSWGEKTDIGAVMVWGHWHQFQ